MRVRSLLVFAASLIVAVHMYAAPPDTAGLGA